MLRAVLILWHNMLFLVVQANTGIWHLDDEEDEDDEFQEEEHVML